MGSISNHYMDIANWVEEIIDSCTTYQQALTARKCIKFFHNQLAIEKSNLSSDYMYLYDRLVDKIEAILKY